ncbi:MAG: glycosyltransferase family 4 protein [Thermomonas hydrothermalis]|uniref:glycosyltransferase family 4 protein n=1 Tax=Thermomonas hydrothermalis TaxID=213588 RepID=UPI00235533B2|nr:glycosyltransferase family 4 protein [Thermomonas hydrothermalis]MCL6618302.1 glycosyltransferase family 4 protein [Thermomonas hydrothermalis]
MRIDVLARNILFLVSAMNAGGAERVAANLANSWAAMGHRVTLLVTYSGRGDCFYALSDQVKLRYLADEVGSFLWRSRKSYLARFFTLRRIVKQVHPDVVVSFLTNVNVAALLATLGMHVSTIVSERTHPPQAPIGRLWSWLRCLVYPFASRVIMLTSEGWRWLQREIPRARGVVMPNPIPYPLPISEPRLAPESVLAPERKMLLAVGRLSEEKGFDFLLSAFAELAHAHLDWDLVILGEGSLRSELERQVQVLGLTGRVHLPGRAGNMGDWYARADLYVMSSRYEGFPNALGEAMAYGCAVVSYDCDTGPRDLIRHGVDGLLVKPVGDVLALARALGQLMRDDALRTRMAAKAVEVRARYSMENILAMWEKLFDDVKS